MPVAPVALKQDPNTSRRCPGPAVTMEALQVREGRADHLHQPHFGDPSDGGSGAAGGWAGGCLSRRYLFGILLGESRRNRRKVTGRYALFSFAFVFFPRTAIGMESGQDFGEKVKSQVEGCTFSCNVARRSIFQVAGLAAGMNIQRSVCDTSWNEVQYQPSMQVPSQSKSDCFFKNVVVVQLKGARMMAYRLRKGCGKYSSPR